MVALGVGVAVLVAWTAPAGATTVSDEATFRAAWSNPAETRIDLATDITLTCGGTAVERHSAIPLILDGHGHTITSTCTATAALVVLNDNTGGGSSPVVFSNVKINGRNATDPVALTSSAVADRSASNAPATVTQVITVEVRKRHHQPRHHGRPGHEPRTTPVVPIPATPVQAVIRFTG